MTADRTPNEPNFDGHCPDIEHRTVGPHRAWSFAKVDGVEWCYVHEAEFVESNPECGMGDQSELPCQTIPLFYRAGDS